MVAPPEEAGGKVNWLLVGVAILGLWVAAQKGFWILSATLLRGLPQEARNLIQAFAMIAINLVMPILIIYRQYRMAHLRP